ncbi:hypothetical protein M378DRAFT_171023 [Amanita muscaria Koide BX008]|uniref:Uncharacterized protein n=1 Tax=Amanita muscaria (strain Koide BX008) TaxID=946122 RepID=A0A0C2SJE4_AMAMK|nr:hypothetical protein M378DRAFT_174539 [Amanita muscaria Koide BX008]KIL54014.1 hypothetical protein M378DRAFT_174487 [Amanita muscaria Koide BX008]KIL58129.1 hypothetical protein M378DRAFT_171023 [Amanita muscaria Koide BX008]
MCHTRCVDAILFPDGKGLTSIRRFLDLLVINTLLSQLALTIPIMQARSQTVVVMENYYRLSRNSRS